MATKMTAKQVFFTFYMATMFTVSLAEGDAYSIDEAYLFNKEQRLDRITIKHQIAYHFQQRAVKEVTQELFISRLISIEPILRGMAVLNETAVKLKKFCESDMISKVEIGRDLSTTVQMSVGPPSDSMFYLVSKKPHTYAEAKARCRSVNKRLPEIYTQEEAYDLAKFQVKTKALTTFLGIEFDPVDQVFRHVGTGLHAARSYFRFRNKTMEPTHMHDIEPYYGWEKGKYVVTATQDAVPALFFTLGEIVNRTLDWPFARGEVRAFVICQDRWDGSTIKQDPNEFSSWIMLDVPGRESYASGYLGNVTNQYQQRGPDKKPGRNGKRNTQATEGTAVTVESELAATCNATISHLTEFYSDLYRKLESLLAHVDVEMMLREQQAEEPTNRSKRFASLLLKVIFKKGTKLLWGLFGFWQQARTEKKIKTNQRNIVNLDLRLNRTEHINRAQQASIDANRRDINSVTRFVKEQSILLNDLIIITADMESRIQSMTSSVISIEKEMNLIKDKIEVLNTLLLVSTLSARVIRSIDGAYAQLADIIYTSLKGQTSPLVLPMSQINRIQVVISQLQLPSTMDKDYSKMKSIITADPEDPSYLLVIVNAAAVSTQKLELVRLIPIPYFDKDRAYFPMLDYNYAALNQPANTFTALTDEEAESCINDRCYIGQMEQNLASLSCGMPQFEDYSLEACDMESFPHNGLFVQAANPDGVLFSFRDKVRTKMFCKSNSITLPQDSIKGAGKMFVPPGCVLQVVDERGKMVKVKGGPSHHLITVSDIELTNDALLTLANTELDVPGSLKRPQSEKEWEKQFSFVQESLDTTHQQVSALQNRLWITIGCTMAIILLMVAVGALLFRYSRRFQYRFKKLIGSIAELSSKLVDLDKIKEQMKNLHSSPPEVKERPKFSWLTNNRPRITHRRPLQEDRDYLQVQSSTEQVKPLAPVTNPRTKLQAGGTAKEPLYPTCPAEDSETELEKDLRSIEAMSILSRPDNEYVTRDSLV